jgi:hypothetical protein
LQNPRLLDDEPLDNSALQLLDSHSNVSLCHQPAGRLATRLVAGLRVSIGLVRALGEGLRERFVLLVLQCGHWLSKS